MRILLYEGKRFLRPMSVWIVSALSLAVASRMEWFPMSDMPLFFLMFFGALGVILFRYHQIMYGWEASFMFSLPISAARQLIYRLSVAAVWCAASTAGIGLALFLQGQDISRLLSALPFAALLLLFLEVFASLFQLALIGCATISLINLPLFKRRQVLWACAWLVAGGVIYHAASSFISSLVPTYVVVGYEGIRFDSSAVNASSFSFSISSFIWQLICQPLCVLLIYKLVRNRLVVEY